MTERTLTGALRDVRAAPWSVSAATLVIAVLALGAALLVPVSFSDPNGVDPYTARLGAAALLMTVPALLLKRLRAARGLLLALLAVAATYTVLTAGPQILVDLFGDGLFKAPLGSADAQVFWASLAQALLTLGIALLTRRAVPARWRPSLRWRLNWSSVAWGIGGSVMLIALGLALPAGLLGRVGLAPVAIMRDLAWLVPANALQGLAQEVQFRGLLLGSLEQTMKPGWANVSQAAVFGLAHLAISYGGPEAPFVPITFLVGLGFGWLVQRTGSIWSATIIHSAADVALQFTVTPGLYGF